MTSNHPHSSSNVSEVLSPLMILMIVAPAASGYFFSYFSRNANVVLIPYLQSDLAISVSDIGLMSGVYFAAFAIVQIPLGILLDRYDAIKVNMGLLPFAVLGSVIFSLSTEIIALTIGRMLIGFGVAGCLMTAFRSFSLWMPPERQAFHNGIVVALGGIGGMVAFYPVEFIVEQWQWNWRDVYLAMAAIFFFQILFIFFVSPRHSPPKVKINLEEQTRDYLEIIRHPKFIAITPLACITMSSFLAMQSLWFGPLLYDGFQLEQTTSIGLISSCALGAIIGNLISGKLLTWARKRGFGFLFVINGMSLIHVTLLLLIALFESFLYWPYWLMMGLTYSGIVLYYAYLGQFLRRHLIGRAMTLGNGFLFVLIFVIQLVFGYGVDISKQFFTLESAYRLTFLGLIMCHLLSFLWQIFYYHMYLREEK